MKDHVGRILKYKKILTMNDLVKLFVILFLAAGGSQAFAQDSDAESLYNTY